MSFGSHIMVVSMLQKKELCSDIGRQLVVLDTLFHALDAGLQQSASFQANPDSKHRGVARADRLQEGGTGAELSENRERTRFTWSALLIRRFSLRNNIPLENI